MDQYQVLPKATSSAAAWEVACGRNAFGWLIGVLRWWLDQRPSGGL